MALPLFSPLDRMLFLKAQPYLMGQPPGVLIALASYSEERFCPAGSVVRPAGAAVETVLFLAEGRVEVKPTAGREGASRFVEAPGVIGLAHHFSQWNESPEIRAATDTLCLQVAAADLDQILEDHFSLLLGFGTRSAGEAERSLRALGASRPAEVGYADDNSDFTPVQLDIVERLAQARRAAFFSRTSLSIVGRLIREDQIEILSRGESLWQAEDPISRMAFIVDGRLMSEGGPHPRTAPPGAVLGTREILSEGVHAEGWRAESTVRLLSVPRESFIDALEDHFDYALEYLRYCACDTLRAWDALADLKGKTES